MTLQNEPINRDSQRKKYCRFRKYGIKHLDYKDPDFLLQFVNEQGKILPRRITGNSLKYQRKVATAVKRARHWPCFLLSPTCKNRSAIILKIVVL